MRILILHGPNLNLLGKRQPDIYGYENFESFLEYLRKSFSNFKIEYAQSNHEGDLIDIIHQSEETFDGVIFNAGGYSHTSVAIADAVASVKTPFIGIHISNIYAREQERHIDLLAKYCIGTITGLGLKGYELALRFFAEKQ
ncbi:MAG: 3-dehydroquinate dehydratase [Bacteroidetes bacterium]|nr:3-dehydroquinate dehydratase [Bacteroidota bacterium]